MATRGLVMEKLALSKVLLMVSSLVEFEQDDAGEKLSLTERWNEFLELGGRLCSAIEPWRDTLV